MSKVRELVKIMIIGGGIASLVGYVIHLEREDMLRSSECWRTQEKQAQNGGYVRRVVYFDCDKWDEQ